MLRSPSLANLREALFKRSDSSGSLISAPLGNFKVQARVENGEKVDRAKKNSINAKFRDAKENLSSLDPDSSYVLCPPFSDYISFVKTDYAGFEKVGEGGSADIRKSKLISDSSRCAIKVFNTPKPVFMRHEIEANIELSDCRFVVRMISIVLGHLNGQKHTTRRMGVPMVVRSLTPAVAFEWMPFGDLCSFDQMTPGIARLFILRDLARAIQHIHKKGWAHRDIKPDNLYLTLSISEMLDSTRLRSDNSGNPWIKLGDFGIAAPFREDFSTKYASAPTTPVATNVWRSNHGSTSWKAPEQNADREIVKERFLKHDERVDIWALGMIAHWMLHGKCLIMENRPYLPYRGKVVAATISEFEVTTWIPWNLEDKRLKDITVQSLDADSGKRPFVEEWVSLLESCIQADLDLRSDAELVSVPGLAFNI